MARYRPPAQVTKVKHMEIWWDYQFTALTKLPHNRPDIVIWNTGKRECIIVDVCVPLDTNVELREETKVDNYIPLVDQLQQIYLRYKFYIVPVIVGALGTVPKSLKENLLILFFESLIFEPVIHKIQKDALLRTMKIVKNFQKL